MTNIYRFTDDCEDKPLLGNKGANLVTMTRLGLRVPPGFVVSIDAFKEYRASNTLPLDEIDEALTWLSDKLGRSFDDGLTVSVRSSAPVSMPGMMDTVLNLGLNQAVANGIARRTGNRRFALDLYRRFIQMYGNVVLGIEASHFDSVLGERRRQANVKLASELAPDAGRHPGDGRALPGHAQVPARARPPRGLPRLWPERRRPGATYGLLGQFRRPWPGPGRTGRRLPLGAVRRWRPGRPGACRPHRRPYSPVRPPR